MATGLLWAAVLCLGALLLLGTKGKPGRGIGGPSTGARNPGGPGAYVERYPEPENDVPPTLEQLNKLRVYDFDPRQGIALDTFTLWTVDDLDRPDPAQQQYVRLTGKQLDNGDYHLVVHVKDAPALQYMFFYVRYHDETWHPRNIEPGSLFGLEGVRLWFAKLDAPGWSAPASCACGRTSTAQRHRATAWSARSPSPSGTSTTSRAGWTTPLTAS